MKLSRRLHTLQCCSSDQRRVLSSVALLPRFMVNGGLAFLGQIDHLDAGLPNWKHGSPKLLSSSPLRTHGRRGERKQSIRDITVLFGNCQRQSTQEVALLIYMRRDLALGGCTAADGMLGQCNSWGRMKATM